MRVLLAAVNAPKGDLAGNLASHVAMLELARVQGCHLAVFPDTPAGRSSLLRRGRLRILVAAIEAQKGDLGGNLAGTWPCSSRPGPRAASWRCSRSSR